MAAVDEVESIVAIKTVVSLGMVVGRPCDRVAISACVFRETRPDVAQREQSGTTINRG